MDNYTDDMEKLKELEEIDKMLGIIIEGQSVKYEGKKRTSKHYTETERAI